MKRSSTTEDFWARVEKTSTCWNWIGSRTTNGYGNLRVGRDTRYAHRVAYEAARGPIAIGMHIDHLCRNRACVNPDHLEPVAPRENYRRGAGVYGDIKTACVRGHDMTDPSNVYTAPRGDKRCRLCARIYEANRASARRVRKGEST